LEKIIARCLRKDPERRAQSIADIKLALEELKDPRIREAITDFLYDVNETARFHAVGATLHQDDPESIPKLVEIFSRTAAEKQSTTGRPNCSPPRRCPRALRCCRTDR